MYIKNVRRSSPFNPRAYAFFLAFFWYLGLLFGIYIGRSVEGFSVLLMHSVSLCRVSILSLLTVTLLPFLLSVALICFSRPELIAVLAFWKAFLVAYCSQLLSSAYCNADWLISYLVLFSEFLTAPIIWFLWFRFSRPVDGRTHYNVVAIGILLAVIIVYFDHRYIAPVILEITK